MKTVFAIILALAVSAMANDNSTDVDGPAVCDKNDPHVYSRDECEKECELSMNKGQPYCSDFAVSVEMQPASKESTEEVLSKEKSQESPAPPQNNNSSPEETTAKSSSPYFTSAFFLIFIMTFNHVVNYFL